MKGRNLRCGVDEHQADDEDLDVPKVESADLAEDIADDEEKRRPRKDTGHLPAFVSTAMRQ